MHAYELAAAPNRAPLATIHPVHPCCAGGNLSMVPGLDLFLDSIVRQQLMA